MQKQFLYDVRLTTRFDEHFMRGNFCIVVWAQSEEAAISAVEKRYWRWCHSGTVYSRSQTTESLQYGNLPDD